MIKLFIGGVGSGKSVSVIKEILDRNKKCFVNFSTKVKGCSRLEIDQIIKEEIVGYKKNGDEITKKVVNWGYWNDLLEKGKEFDIYIDEAHNIMHSRRSMSSWNTLFTMWLSQIRKILGSSETSNLYLITQRVGGLDVSARDLCHEIIYMYKYEIPLNAWTHVLDRKNHKIKKSLPVIKIVKHVFSGDYCIQNFMAFIMTGNKTYNYRSCFIANPYYQFYNSYELLNFGNGVYV